LAAALCQAALLHPAPNPPEWARGALWYQVFPERFRNGSGANDPASPDITLKDWRSDWWRVSPEEVEAGWARAHGGAHRYRFDPRRTGGSRYNVVWNRRYGGDLQGLVDKLDHIESLGVDAIYICPVFRAPSLHKYDTADHRHIDPTLAIGERAVEEHGDPSDPGAWAWTPSDRYFVDTVLPESHERGLRVVIDGVWNHVGREHFAFRHLLENGRSSKFAEWFNADFDAEGRVTGWRAWDGRDGKLPEFRQTPSGDLVPPVKDHIFAVTRRWMDPNLDGDPSDGVDGWRLDVATEIGDAFWRDWREHVKSINPEAVLIAEIWSDASETLDGSTFDAQMNYPLAEAIVMWAKGAWDAEAVTRASEQAITHNTRLAQMNLLASHDTERLVSMMASPDRGYSQDAKLHQGHRASPARPSPEAHARARLALALSVLLPGSPTLFAGDEFGMHGPDDPDNRKPVPWPDLGPMENPDDRADLDHLREIRRILALRSDPAFGPTLRTGDAHWLEAPTADVIAFERRSGSQRLLCLLSRRLTPCDLHDRVPDAGTPIPPLSFRIVPLSR